MLAPLVRRAVVMLALGLLTAWVVAWACAWFVPLEGVCRAPAGGRVVMRSLGVTQMREDRRPIRRVEGAAGWPMRALRWTCDINTSPAFLWSRQALASAPSTAPFAQPATPARKPPEVRWALQPLGEASSTGAPRFARADDMPLRHLLPLRPIWRGLLINATIFSGAWSITLAMLTARLRLSRWRSGRCPICKYDLRGLPEERCPECGTLTDHRGMRRNRWLGAAAPIALALAAGIATTIAIAWWCGARVRYDGARSEEGWLTEPPSDWLVRRYDAFGSTRVAWLYDEDPATARRDEQRRRRAVAARSLTEDSREFLVLQAHAQERRERTIAWQKFMSAARDDVAPSWLPGGPDVLGASGHMRSQVIDARGWPMRAMWSVFETSSYPGFSAGAIDQRCFDLSGGVPVNLSQYRNMHTAAALPLRIVWPGFLLDSAAFALAWLMLGAALTRTMKKMIALVRTSWLRIALRVNHHR